MPYFYIYKMTHPETGEFYIGRRTSNLPPNEDSYRGSSTTWYSTLSRDVIQNVLVKEILQDSISSAEELNQAEIEWISENIKNPLCKNAHIPSIGFYPKGPKSEETKIKMSVTKKGKTFSDEAKLRMSESKKGRTLSEETKKKISDSIKGSSRTEETKLKMSESKKGRTLSEETKKKISESKKNISEETRKKMSIAKMNQSEETRKKISDSMKARKNKNLLVHSIFVNN